MISIGIHAHVYTTVNTSVLPESINTHTHTGVGGERETDRQTDRQAENLVCKCKLAIFFGPHQCLEQHSLGDDPKLVNKCNAYHVGWPA